VNDLLEARVPRVKCVVWDLDETVWDGVAAEGATDRLPDPRPGVLAAIDSLAELGVLISVASRTAPWVKDLLQADPRFAERFLVPQVAWQDKSESLRVIADELGIGLSSLVLVDNSPYERAEVSAMLPEVRTLMPEDVPELLASLRMAPVTEDGRERVQRYREELTRREAGKLFRGSRADFLRFCQMRLTVGEVADDEIERFAELLARTNRLNSSGFQPSAADIRAAREADPRGQLIAYLSDRFGDYGMIGAAVVTAGTSAWSVDVLALSCRIAGRGVSAAFLGWIADRAAQDGAAELRVAFRPTAAKSELRVLFRQLGLRVATGGEAQGDDPQDGRARIMTRSLRDEMPVPPPWVEIVDRPVVACERRLRAGPGRTGDPEPASPRDRPWSGRDGQDPSGCWPLRLSWPDLARWRSAAYRHPRGTWRRRG
jgi:methoxymalonate biosynthesis protein